MLPPAACGYVDCLRVSPGGKEVAFISEVFLARQSFRTRQERPCDVVDESVLSEYCVSAHQQHPKKRMAPLTRPIQVLAVYPRSAHSATLRVGGRGAVQ